MKSTPTSPPTPLRKSLHLEMGCEFLQAKGIQNYTEGSRAEKQITCFENFSLGVKWEWKQPYHDLSVDTSGGKSSSHPDAMLLQR